MAPGYEFWKRGVEMTPGYGYWIRLLEMNLQTAPGKVLGRRALEMNLQTAPGKVSWRRTLEMITEYPSSGISLIPSCLLCRNKFYVPTSMQTAVRSIV